MHAGINGNISRNGATAFRWEKYLYLLSRNCFVLRTSQRKGALLRASQTQGINWLARYLLHEVFLISRNGATAQRERSFIMLIFFEVNTIRLQ